MKNSIITKDFLASLIIERLRTAMPAAKAQYEDSKDRIGYFFVDDVLPDDIAAAIDNAFPKPEEMSLNKSLRQHKHIAAQLDRYHPLLEEAIYAFQDAKVVSLVQSICEIDILEPDTHLYAGGISTMRKGQFFKSASRQLP